MLGAEAIVRAAHICRIRVRLGTESHYMRRRCERSVRTDTCGGRASAHWAFDAVH